MFFPCSFHSTNFSPQIFHDEDLWTIVKFFMKYAVDITQIPKDVYDLIQILFNQISISTTGNWDDYYEKHRLNFGIIRIHENLLDKLTENLKRNPKDDDMRRTNLMLMKLCLMTFYNYQRALIEPAIDKELPIQNANSISIFEYNHEREIQTKIIDQLFGIFQARYDYVLFDRLVIDEHFVMQLDRFFYKNTEPERITEILQYVLFCFNFFTPNNCCNYLFD